MRDRLKTSVGRRDPDLQIRSFGLTWFGCATVLPQPTIGYPISRGKSPHMKSAGAQHRRKTTNHTNRRGSIREDARDSWFFLLFADRNA